MSRNFSKSNLDDDSYLRSLNIDPSVVRELAARLNMPFNADDVEEDEPEDD